MINTRLMNSIEYDFMQNYRIAAAYGADQEKVQALNSMLGLTVGALAFWDIPNLKKRIEEVYNSGRKFINAFVYGNLPKNYKTIKELKDAFAEYLAQAVRAYFPVLPPEILTKIHDRVKSKIIFIPKGPVQDPAHTLTVVNFTPVKMKQRSIGDLQEFYNKMIEEMKENKNRLTLEQSKKIREEQQRLNEIKDIQLENLKNMLTEEQQQELKKLKENEDLNKQSYIFNKLKRAFNVNAVTTTQQLNTTKEKAQEASKTIEDLKKKIEELNQLLGA